MATFRPLPLLLIALLVAGAAHAGEPAILSPAVDWLQLRGGILPLPTVHAPHRLPGAAAALATPSVAPPLFADPLFADTGLWRRPPAGPEVFGLPVGAAIWDRSSSAWFLPMAGMVVRLTADRQLRRLVDNIDSLDMDIRTAAGLLVARTADDRIILRRLGDGGGADRTLLSGPAFFEPRLSPDGQQVLVSQSHAEGGRMWLVNLDGAKRDVGQGYGPVWMPDGAGLLFARVVGRSQQIRDAELWHLDLNRGVERQLTATPHIAEIEPAVSPDGHWLAYGDAKTGDLCVAAWPKPPQGR